MTKREFIEATASGLRKMNYTPDYLLIIADRFNDWEWDEDTLCGILVIKNYIVVNLGYSGHDYPVTLVLRMFQKMTSQQWLIGFKEALKIV